MQDILVIHGPNLNLLGWRNPAQYGTVTLDEMNVRIQAHAGQYKLAISIMQSNIEGEIVTAIQNTPANNIIINPGGYTHTSVAIRDAIEGVNKPAIEVHISNIQAREDFRHTSLIAPACIGQITGFGVFSYILAVEYFAKQGTGA